MFQIASFQAVLNVIGMISLSALFGGMVFFPSVVAPTVFKALDTEDAGRFLRRLFPAYYVFMIVSSLVAAAALYTTPTVAIGLLVVAGSTFAVMRLLVPKINAWRDAELAGDEGAARKFEAGHRTSVIVNLLQLLFVAAALVQIWRL